MSVESGDLNRTVTIRRKTVTHNALNEEVETWADFFTCKARRRDFSDGEAIAAQQFGSFLRSRFVVRSSSETRTLTPVDELAHDGETWSIHGVKELNEGQFRFIEITAAKDNDADGQASLQGRGTQGT